MFVLPGIERDVFLAEALIGLATGFHKEERDQNYAILALTGEGPWAGIRYRALALFLFDTERRKRILALLEDEEECQAVQRSIVEIEKEIVEHSERIKQALPRLKEIGKTLQAAIDKGKAS